MLKRLNSPGNYPILREARLAQFQPPFLAQLGIFVLIFISSQVVQGIATALAMLPSLLQTIIPQINAGGAEIDISPEKLLDTMGDGITLVMLFSTVIIILFTFIYCRKIEKRSYFSMGFSKTNFATQYLAGLLAGAALFAVTVLICMPFGAVRFEAVSNIPAQYILLFFVAFLIQGMSEEVMCRGYFMVSLSNRSSVILAVLANSLVFSLLHIVNANVTFLALCNIFLFGVFASVYMLFFNNIWGICALHAAWNFVQGNIFGSNVSGMALESRVWTMFPAEKYELLTGGAFGIEGGLAMTIVLGVSIAIFTYLLIKRVSRQTPEDGSAVLAAQPEEG